MFDLVFSFLGHLDEIFWGYFAFILIIALGSYLTIKNKFFQILSLPRIFKTFFSVLREKRAPGERGIHPFRAFFASLGAMVGIGNVVGIVTAVQMGGPGALFWVWVAGMIGAIVKYSEIFLGLKYRTPNAQGSFDGGPMYFLKKTFKTQFVPITIAILLCIYGVDIYQFSVVTDSITSNWGLNKYLIICTFLAFVIYGSIGGVKRIGRISSWLMPLFIISYVGMALFVIFSSASAIPEVLYIVLKSAFTGHAATGGFAGASMILAIQHGIARAAYSSDIGIGFDSIIQSESNTVYPQRQACLAIIGVGIDNFICTISILLVLLTGVWRSVDPIAGSKLVQTALSLYFPYMKIFIPLFLTIAGYTTLIAYLCVGLKSATYLVPKHGRRFYLFYAIFALFFFSFFDQKQTLLIMSVAQALLLIINLLGIFRLRNHVFFSADDPALHLPAAPQETLSKNQITNN